MESVRVGCGDDKEVIEQVTSKYKFDITFGFGVPIGAGLGSSGSFN